jgi:hypothetical protein
MKKIAKLIPVIAIIFLLSTLSVILITNIAGKADIKDSVIRVQKIIRTGELILDKSGENVKRVKLSKDWLSGVSYFCDIDSLKGLYAKETLYPGDIIRADRVERDNQLIAYSTLPGYERIAVEIENPYNGVNFQISSMESIALDCTIDGTIAKMLNFTYGKTILKDAFGFNGTLSMRILDRVKIISLCDKYGKPVSYEERENSNNKDINSILIDVTKDDAMIIQMLRGNDATFEITKVAK